MRNSPHFVFDVVACAVLAIIFWTACAGLGTLVLPSPRPVPANDTPDDNPDDSAREHERTPASWHQPGVAAGVGLGVLLLLGGFGVLFRIPWWLLVVPSLVAGIGLAIRALSDAGIARPSRSTLVIGALAITAFGLVALAEAPLGLRFRLGCDDLRAYLPLARRLLATNGLEEPWSARRLQSLGGFDLLRALPVSVFGNAGVGVAETVLASVFLAGLFVANGVRSTWARLLSVGFILAVPLLWVPRANTTGVLIGVPLLVVVLAGTVELRKALRAGDRTGAVRWAIAVGLVSAALMSVRPNLGLFGATLLASARSTATGATHRCTRHASWRPVPRAR